VTTSRQDQRRDRDREAADRNPALAIDDREHEQQRQGQIRHRPVRIEQEIACKPRAGAGDEHADGSLRAQCRERDAAEHEQRGAYDQDAGAAAKPPRAPRRRRRRSCDVAGDDEADDPEPGPEGGAEQRRKPDEGRHIRGPPQRLAKASAAQQLAREPGRGGRADGSRDRQTRRVALDEPAQQAADRDRGQHPAPGEQDRSDRDADLGPDGRAGLAADIKLGSKPGGEARAERDEHEAGKIQRRQT
jgi:hypothetical protein